MAEFEPSCARTTGHQLERENKPKDLNDPISHQLEGPNYTRSTKYLSLLLQTMYVQCKSIQAV